MSLSKMIVDEMLRRQNIADTRDNDSTLSDLCDGSTTEADFDSHQYHMVMENDGEMHCGCDDCEGVTLFI